jgi:hypothetical protein
MVAAGGELLLRVLDAGEFESRAFVAAVGFGGEGGASGGKLGFLVIETTAEKLLALGQLGLQGGLATGGAGVGFLVEEGQGELPV